MNVQEQLNEFNRSVIVYPPICNSAADPKQKHTVALFKHLADWYCNDNEFRALFRSNPEKALESINLEVSVNAALVLIKLLEEGFLSVPAAQVPEEVKMYYSYMNEKIAWRTNAQNELDVPKHPAFKKWRQKQVNRCWGQFGGENYAFVHVPLVFEMAVGCSVGCPFCALSSDSLKKLFRATPENMQLWDGVLDVVKDIIGPAAGEGVLYFATEPLDNPDYEHFSQLFEEKLGKVPQITTAVAMRNPERVRKIINADSKKDKITIHRFSVLTLEIFRAIMEAFTPDELLYVELLGRYPESLLGNLTKAGRSYEGEEAAAAETTNTISCCTGFIVNMADKTIRLTCPTDADDNHPTGEIQTPRIGFADAEDLRCQMLNLIKEHMPMSMPMDKKLSFAPFFSFTVLDNGFMLSSKASFKVRFRQDNEAEMPFYKRVGELINEGRYTGREIVQILIEEKQMNPSLVFNLLRYIDRTGSLVY